MGYFEKREFSSIPTAEVLKKPKSQSEKMIPTQGGKHCCWQEMEKRQHQAPPVHSKQAKVSKSCGYFQKSKFSSIPTAEVSKKAKNAFPPSMGIKQKHASHAAWGSQFLFCQHPSRENAHSNNCTPHDIVPISCFWAPQKSNISLEGLNNAKKHNFI